MTLAIFDLDNTLIAGDSDHRWGQFLCAEGLVDAEQFAQSNDAFYQAYLDGDLDIYAYLRFALSPIQGMTVAEVSALQKRFLDAWIEPILLPAAFDLIAQHRDAGDQLLIITATNTAVTRPIADRLGIADLLGCEAEIVDDRYTGASVGTPTYREGKVTRMAAWTAEQGIDSTGAWFYSDSHNDLPLLERVDNPVAVDPDSRLEAVAEARGWPVISLRQQGAA